MEETQADKERRLKDLHISTYQQYADEMILALWRWEKPVSYESWLEQQLDEMWEILSK